MKNLKKNLVPAALVISLSFSWSWLPDWFPGASSETESSSFTPTKPRT